MDYCVTAFWAMDTAKIVQLKSFISTSLLMAMVIASSIKININITHIIYSQEQ